MSPDIAVRILVIAEKRQQVLDERERFEQTFSRVERYRLTALKERRAAERVTV